jgi:hypothetical protein
VVPIGEENPVFKRSATMEVSTAYDQAREKAAQAAGTTTAAVMTARDRLAPRIDNAREHLGPAIEDARERLAPAFDSVKESSTDALHQAVEAMAPVVAAARAKGSELLTSDTAHEARNRAALMLAAAKGEPVGVRKRRWPLAAAFFALGTAIGAAVAMLTSRSARVVTPDAEESIAGPRLDMSQPLTEAEPQPVSVLSDAQLSDSDLTPTDYASDEGSAPETTSTEPDGSLTKPRARR